MSPRPSLWALENLHAWEAPTFDLVERSSDERARMLTELGIRRYAYLPRGDPAGLVADLNTSQLDVDEEISAMTRHGIEIRAWYFWINTDDPAEDPVVTSTLAAFRRHGIRPQIWMPQSFADPHPESRLGHPVGPAAQRERVRREADRVARLVRLAAPAGCPVNLYNHRGWFGMVDNQLAILDRLAKIGIRDVGLVYNFGHSRSDDHDDLPGFAALWDRIRPHVAAVNVFFSEGTREAEMMRAIEVSGWTGPVGIEPIGFVGNAELMFRNALWNLGWASARLASGDHAE